MKIFYYIDMYLLMQTVKNQKDSTASTPSLIFGILMTSLLESKIALLLPTDPTSHIGTICICLLSLSEQRFVFFLSYKSAS